MSIFHHAVNEKDKSAFKGGISLLAREICGGLAALGWEVAKAAVSRARARLW